MTRRAAHPDPESLGTLRTHGARVTKAPAGDVVLDVARAPEPPRVEPGPEVERVKVGFYVPVTDAARIRAAFAHTRKPGGAIKSLSDYIAAAVLRQVDEDEAAAGAPFEPLPPGAIGTGRPLGS